MCPENKIKLIIREINSQKIIYHGTVKLILLYFKNDYYFLNNLYLEWHEAATSLFLLKCTKKSNSEKRIKTHLVTLLPPRDNSNFMCFT